MVNLEQMSNRYISMIDEALNDYIMPTGDQYDRVKEAMLYALNAGGKRVRPILTLEFCRINGGDLHRALPFACAVEMVHCYSMIHDDLPCMDDDDMRRGKPSCHKEFGEAIALLAGDALLTLAFEVIASASGMLPPERCIEAVKTLSTYAGMDGMVGGQTLDIINEGVTIDEQTLHVTHLKKTAALIKAACRLGAIAAGANAENTDKCVKAGQHFGLAFQIIDDVLDVCGDEKVLGKPHGSDASNKKTTYVSIYGVETARRIADESKQHALNIVKQFEMSSYLEAMIVNVLGR